VCGGGGNAKGKTQMGGTWKVVRGFVFDLHICTRIWYVLLKCLVKPAITFCRFCTVIVVLRAAYTY